jgi:hypothetical protein
MRNEEVQRDITMLHVTDDRPSFHRIASVFEDMQVWVTVE